MKIAWYTPFSVDSAIGRFSQLVVEQLLRRENVQVDVIRSEDKRHATKSHFPIDARVVWAHDIDRKIEQRLSDYDLVVYNVGDHYQNHAYCFLHQKRVPGLSILHDYILHHALDGFCRAVDNRFGTYRQHLKAECGPESLDHLDHTLQTRGHEHWWHSEIARFPIYRWALVETLGVITHAEFYQKTVAARLGCPATTIPLAYGQSDGKTAKTVVRDDDRMVILTFGAVNPNKRYASVIKSIAESPMLRERCVYRIVGAIDPNHREAIEKSIRDLRHPPEVVWTGHVDAQSLQAELNEADIISCLRFPALEGASASAVEGLLSGKPVVVSDTGCYAEIPSDLVYKIDPRNELDELKYCLEQIVSNYGSALTRAGMARVWACKRNSASSYATDFIEFAHQVLANQPLLRVTDRIASHLKQWNVAADNSFVTRIGESLRDMFPDVDHEQRAKAA